MSDHEWREGVDLVPTDPNTARLFMQELGVGVDIYRSSIDGAVVVHIDTEEDKLPCDTLGPTGLRVYINDDTDNPIWDGGPGPDGTQSDGDADE